MNRRRKRERSFAAVRDYDRLRDIHEDNRFEGMALSDAEEAEQRPSGTVRVTQPGRVAVRRMIRGS